MTKPNLIFADTTSNPFKDCKAKPANPSPEQEVLLEVETKNETRILATIHVVNQSTNKEVRLINQPMETEKTRIRTYSLGSYTDPVTYKIQVNNATTEGGVCIRDAAFIVTPSSSNLRLIAPQSPITERIKTLPSLNIGGLEPHKTYNIKLYNWKGDDLANHTRSNPNDWLSDDSGNITAQNICNDGKTNRTNCTDPFGDGKYSLEVKEKNGVSKGTVSFEVNVITSGKNPCEGGTCKTALGNIPTNATAFAQKFLEIAVGVAGGIALILMVVGSIRVLASSGDQQKLTGGRDMIVAAIAGLLFLIFSVLILQFIGFQILKIPFVGGAPEIGGTPP